MRSANILAVGIDTARYGHHAAFLNQNLQPAAPDCRFEESRAGYAKLQKQILALAKKHPDADLRVRIDAAGQYAVNLEAFLRSLPLPLDISVGEPAKNCNYRKAHFTEHESDAIEAKSVARFAVVEQPPPTPALDQAVSEVREIAKRLRQLVKHQNRLHNQLHGLLARVFPELAKIATDFSARWTLLLLDKYPTARRLANAQRESLLKIPFLSEKKAKILQQAAKDSVGSFQTKIAETLVRDFVKGLRETINQKRSLEQMLTRAYHRLPNSNHLDSIPGIGAVTAAILTAKIVDIDRFETPEKLVGYFGVHAEINDSGVHRSGETKSKQRKVISKRGDDLVRSYLYNAARCACQHNPACRALYRRLMVNKTSSNAAFGHLTRKLLHLVFAVWKTDTPFNKDHYPWENSKRLNRTDKDKRNAAGRTPPSAARQAVTATLQVQFRLESSRCKA